ncbi:hypothetical protein [Bacillus sp. EB01]|uniref:hypothetical protein n=1 Tax=Bacillus sp. EB01 TaxID=1347086 RepID=UPI0012DFB830|nr:hypothetical protein [Bacillus sp. EB01]
MDKELKLALGKILGEIYRIQKAQEIDSVSDSRLFGLLNGFEEAIDSELGNLQFISDEDVKKVTDELAPYWNGERDIEEIPSFMTFRMDLERKGISHSKVVDILKYLKADGRFQTEIERLGTFNLGGHDL